MPAPLAIGLDLVVEADPPPGLDLDLAAWETLARFVLATEGQDGPWSIAAVLVGDDRLRALHREFMGLDSTTDVMTFPAGASGTGVADQGLADPSAGRGGDPGPAPGRGGDIVVSVDRAREQAAAFGHTPAEEVRFLFVHGLLHLAGWDDATAEQRARMLERGAALLRDFDAR